MCKVEMDLAVQFDVENSNGFTVSKEKYKELLQEERIQEMLTTDSLFLIGEIPTNGILGFMNATSSINNIVGKIQKIDVDTRKVEIKLTNKYYEDIIGDCKVGTFYLGTKKCLDRILGFHIIDKNLISYDYKNEGCLNMQKSISHAIAIVRETGITNMFQRDKVLELMKEFGFENESNYLKEHKEEYSKYLDDSSDYLNGEYIDFIGNKEKLNIDEELAKKLDWYKNLYDYSFKFKYDGTLTRFDMQQPECEGVDFTLTGVVKDFLKDLENRIEQYGDENNSYQEDLKIFKTFINNL